MTDLEKSLEKAKQNPEFVKEWEAIQPELEIMRAMIDARNGENMTQKELSKKTGIAQGDISKIERGNINPTLQTMIRLAQGMGKKLEVKFV